MASTSNAYDFDLFDSRDHGSAAPKLPEPKAPQKQKQKNNVVKLDEKQLRRSHRHSANLVKMLMNLAVVLVIVGAIGAVVLCALFWRRANRWGALAGMIGGGVMVFVWKFVIKPMGGVWGSSELLPAFLTSLILIVVVSLLTPAPEQEIVDEFDRVKAIKY